MTALETVGPQTHFVKLYARRCTLGSGRTILRSEAGEELFEFPGASSSEAGLFEKHLGEGSMAFTEKLEDGSMRFHSGYFLQFRGVPVMVRGGAYGESQYVYTFVTDAK
jgi:hypothetical protein